MRHLATPFTTGFPSAIDTLILTSADLKRKVLPEGLATSPYEILDYQHTLVLHDPYGRQASFLRRQQIRFLQSGVSSILDHAWGDGVMITSYRNDAGELEESIREAGQRHLVIGLKRVMNRGDRLTFRVERDAMEGFTQDEEWFESTIDRPIWRLEARVVFPKGRPCQTATIDHGGRQIVLPIIRVRSGQTVVCFRTEAAEADTPYRIRWTW